MKILITGADGFIGRYLANKFEKENHIVYRITHKRNGDLADPNIVQEIFEDICPNHVNAIIHCAIVGGRRTKPDSSSVVYENIAMFENINLYSYKADQFITFGSGADQFLSTYYGLSKHIIKCRINQIHNASLIRIFGCFDVTEEDDRFIKSTIIKCLKNEPIFIFDNRKFDYIYLNDLWRLTNAYVQLYKPLKAIDAVYRTKFTLLEIAEIIKRKTNSKSNIEVTSSSSVNYVGDHYPNFDFDGLLEALEDMILKTKRL